MVHVIQNTVYVVHIGCMIHVLCKVPVGHIVYVFHIMVSCG